MKTEQEKIINKFLDISNKYHNLSLLFYELSKSIDLELKHKGINPNSRKQIKEHIKSLDLDFNKIKDFTLSNIAIKDLKKEK